MGKTRDSANLVSDKNITIDIVNDRVGIGSTVPTSKLQVIGDGSISGVITATTFNGNIVGTAATFTGNVSVAGTLTYEDVTNVDSIGIVTARSGAHVATVSGNLLVGTTSATGTASQPLQVIGGAYVSTNLGIGATNPTTFGNNSTQLAMSGYNAGGGSGYHQFLGVTNTFGSATNPNKFFRLNSTGGIEVLNSGYTSVIHSLDNSGNTVVTGTIQGTRLISTIATGTSPLSVTSTTVVTNLNADLLDGLNASSTNTSSTVVARDASGNFDASNLSLSGNLTVSTGNATGGGIILADDGDIVDLNDGFCTMRFSSGTRIYSGNRTGSAVITLSNAGNITATGNVTAYSSDERLKENVKNLENSLEKVLQLNGCTFDWNEKSKELGFKPKHETNDIGLLAQEVEKVLPQAVDLAPFDSDYEDGEKVSKSGENYLTIQYERLVPLLVEAIKEQQEQINTLRREIEELKK